MTGITAIRMFEALAWPRRDTDLAITNTSLVVETCNGCVSYSVPLRFAPRKFWRCLKQESRHQVRQFSR